MKFTFESDMVRGQCYRCPLWQEDYDEDGGWAEYCKLDHEVDAYGEDPSCCPLKESNEVNWHPYPEEKPTPTEKDYNAKPFLITIRQRDGYEFVTISVYHFLLSVFEKVRYYGDSSITAWAELPKPYKKEETNDI